MERKIFFLILTIFLSGQTIGQINLEDGYIADSINKTPDNITNNSEMTLTDKVYMPGDYGGMPLDVETVDNNVFVCTDKKLLKFTDQYDLDTSYLISNNAGRVRHAIKAREYSIFNKNLTYSSVTNELFVANNDGEIGYLNMDNGHYEQLNSATISNIDEYSNTKLLIDEENENLIWLYSSANHSYIKVLNLQTKEVTALREFPQESIIDITLNSDKNIVARGESNLKIFKIINSILFPLHESDNLGYSGTAIFIPNKDEIVSFNRDNITIHDDSLLNTKEVVPKSENTKCRNYLYSPGDSAVYFTHSVYNSIIHYYTKLDLTNNSLLPNQSLFRVEGLEMSPNGAIIVSGAKKIRMVDPRTLQTLQEKQTNTFYNKLEIFDTMGSIFAISSRGGLAGVFDSNLNEVNYNKLAVNASKGCVNPDNNKYYYINTNVYNKYSSVYIYDADNNLLNTIELNARLKSIQYNNQKVYVASSLTDSVYIIDGQNDTYLSAINVPNTSSDILDLYSSKNYIYAVGSMDITVISNNNIEQTYNMPDVTNVSDFYFDKTSNKAYFLLTKNDVSSKIYSIDENTLNLEELYTLNGGAQFMYIRPDINRIYLAKTKTSPSSNRYIKVLNQNTFELVTEKYINGAIFNDFRYSPVSDEVYIFDNRWPSYLHYITSDDTIKEIKPNITGHIYNSAYNPQNNKLYWYGRTWDNNEQNAELRLYEFSCENKEIEGYLDFNEYFDKVVGHRIIPPHNMFVNVDSNKLYVGNHTFSNACVVQCPPFEKEYNPGWTWTSYPILERENDNPVPAIPLLENLEPMPSSMKFYHLEYVSKYDDETWDPTDVDEIRSTLGYKLYNNTQTTSYLETPGTLLDEEHPIELSEGENWIGYFPQQPRDAFDALQGVLDDIDMFKTQDGGCYKDNAKLKDSGEQWICWINEDHGYTALERGEMVVVNATSPTTLVWNQDAPVKQKQALPESQNFTYQELADYQSIFVETDTSQVDEIGVFLNGECIGAAVVVDTLQEVRAYILEDESGTLSFELYSQGSRSKQVVKSYEIIRPRNRQQTAIRAQNKARYYWVSLKSALGSEEREASAHALQVYPNPTTGQVTMHISINKQTAGSLQLFNAKGVLLKTLHRGELSKGSHTFTINARENLPAGVYLYTFKTDEGVTNGKIVIE
ncbi:MAG: T9SS type A sorting domain-containing protein [Bacteroidales bacterium]|nr:T9SS type A sorting domain-containing protein [Bacteroidales bacterium]